MTTTTTRRARTTAGKPEPAPPAPVAPGPPAGTPAGSYLRHVDPRVLRVHPANLRTELGDLTDLKASIAVHGVVQALTVVPDDDPPTVLMGHHRRAAAVEVLAEGDWPAQLPETVPCLVRPDLVGVPADQLAQMLVENDDDQRRGLRPSEQAAGYAQLAAFDLDPAEIARRTGKTAKHVTAVLKLNAAAAPVREHVDAGLLSLQDMAALDEFADDPKAVARILAGAGSSWGIRHSIAAEQRKRADAAEVQKIRAELTAAGIAVVAKPKDWPYGCAAARIVDLVDTDGNSVDPEQVNTRDGFAAFIDRHPPTAVLICLDPAAHGYTRTGHSSFQSAAQREAEEAARAEAESRLAALDDARVVRHRFLVDSYGSAKAAKELFLDALRTAVQHPAGLDRGDDDLIQALAGGDIHATADAKLDRLSRLLTARWVAAQEDNLAVAGEPVPWQRPDPARAVAWLDRLVAAGYELCDAEATLRTDLADQVAARSTADSDDCAVGSAADDDTDLRYVLMYGPADGWVLLDERTGDAIDTWVAGPELLAEAQRWAAGSIAGHHSMVTGWRVLADAADEPASWRYLAETVPAATADGPPVDTAPAADVGSTSPPPDGSQP